MMFSFLWTCKKTECSRVFNGILYFNGLCNFSGSGVSHFKPRCQICCITILKRIVTGDAIPIGSKIDATRLNSFLWLYIAAFFGNSSNGFMKNLSITKFYFCPNTRVKSFDSSKSSHGICSSISVQLEKNLVNLKPPRWRHSLTCITVSFASVIVGSEWT